MGYYTQLIDSDFKIPETPEVLEALKSMPAKYKKVQNGGSWSKGGARESWFSWIDDATILNAETAESIFQELGFETISKDGFFHLIGYESKIGQEDLFLSTVAPFVAEGSYTTWKGEDDAHYKYVVKDRILHASKGSVKISYPEEEPFTIAHYCSDDECHIGSAFHYHYYYPTTMEEL